jgi:hypothetical protein
MEHTILAFHLVLLKRLLCCAFSPIIQSLQCGTFGSHCSYPAYELCFTSSRYNTGTITSNLWRKKYIIERQKQIITAKERNARVKHVHKGAKETQKKRPIAASDQQFETAF